MCQNIMSVEKEMKKSLNLNAFCEFMLANAQNQLALSDATLF
jgi:hypothetical protein